jgi:hypothetical protein
MDHPKIVSVQPKAISLSYIHVVKLGQMTTDFPPPPRESSEIIHWINLWILKAIQILDCDLVIGV